MTQQHIDFIADRSPDVTLFIAKFRHRNLPFRLVADVHHDEVVVHLDNPASDYFSLLDILKALIVEILHGVEVFKVRFEHSIIVLRRLG